MAKDRNGSLPVINSEEEAAYNRDRAKKTKMKSEETDESNGEGTRTKKRRSKKRSRRRHRDGHSSSSYSSSSEDSSSTESESDGSDSEESESERRRRKKKERRRKKEREYERERQRRKEKERKRKRDKEGKGEKRKEKRHKKKRGKEKEEGRTGAVTDSWGKYGVIRETDMWNKRPEFTAWLSEVKQVNLESLPNWEEKQMFKEFMEDHNTATFPSKKYYDLDAYHRHMLGKEIKKGLKNVSATERTVFNDEEQRRQELQRERERQKEEQVETLKRSMQSGMAQAMKEQAQLREEMAYQYRLGNFEAAAAIQRRLDPDVAM